MPKRIKTMTRKNLPVMVGRFMATAEKWKRLAVAAASKWVGRRDTSKSTTFWRKQKRKRRNGSAEMEALEAALKLTTSKTLHFGDRHSVGGKLVYLNGVLKRVAVMICTQLVYGY